MLIFIDASRVHPNGGAMLQLQYLAKFRGEALDGRSKLVIFANDLIVSNLKEKYENCIFKNTQGKFVFWIWFQFYCWFKRPNIVLNFGPNFFLCVKYITIMHSQLPFDLKMYRRYSLYKRIRLFIQLLTTYLNFTLAHKIIVLSQNSKNTLEKFFISEKKLELIPHGVEVGVVINSENQRKFEDFRFICVSPILEYKNHDYLIRTFDQLRKLGYTNFSVHFIGELVPYSKKIINLMNSLDPNREFLHHIQPEGRLSVLDFASKCSMAIYGSSCESFGIILVELMLMKIPILANDYSTTREILKDGGLYFNVNDQDSLVCLIREVLDGELEYDIHINKAHQYALNYDPKAMAFSIFNLLKNSEISLL